MGRFFARIPTGMLERPRRAPARFRSTIQRMLDELEGNRLEVCCIPSIFPELADRGAKIRCVASQNTPWYQDYCRQWEARRTRPRRKLLHDTRVKRRETILALQGLLNGGTRSIYVNDLLEMAVVWKKKWRDEWEAQRAYYKERDFVPF